jgi:hypothetical protein
LMQMSFWYVWCFFDSALYTPSIMPRAASAPASDVRRALDKRERQVCKEPKYPGGPREWRYVPETCRRRERGEGRTRSAGSLHQQQLAVIERWLAAHPERLPDPPAQVPQNPQQVAQVLQLILKKSAAMQKVTNSMFAAMVSKAAQREHADPNARFAAAWRDLSLPTLLPRTANLMTRTKQAVYKLMVIHLRA